MCGCAPVSLEIDRNLLLGLESVDERVEPFLVVDPHRLALDRARALWLNALKKLVRRLVAVEFWLVRVGVPNEASRGACKRKDERKRAGEGTLQMRV